MVPVPAVGEKGSESEVVEEEETGPAHKEGPVETGNAEAFGKGVGDRWEASHAPQGEIEGSEGSESRDGRGGTAPTYQQGRDSQDTDGEAVREQSQRPLGRFRPPDRDVESEGDTAERRR